MNIHETVTAVSSQLQNQAEAAKQQVGTKSAQHEAYLHKQQESQVMKILHEVLPKENAAKVNKPKEQEKRERKQKKQKFTVYTPQGIKKEIGEGESPEIDRTM